MFKPLPAFSLSELLIVIGILGLFTSVLFVFLGNSLYKDGDTKTSLRFNGTNINYQYESKFFLYFNF